jgi:hypothetical protein
MPEILTAFRRGFRHVECQIRWTCIGRSGIQQRLKDREPSVQEGSEARRISGCRGKSSTLCREGAEIPATTAL